jgi:hypothetical protein
VIDPTAERLVPLSEARQLIPNRPDKATVYRWYARGVAGVKLETLMVGGRRYTSQEAIRRFFERRTATADAAISAGSTADLGRQKQADRHDESVERELDARGIGPRPSRN